MTFAVLQNVLADEETVFDTPCCIGRLHYVERSHSTWPPLRNGIVSAGGGVLPQHAQLDAANTCHLCSELMAFANQTTPKCYARGVCAIVKVRKTCSFELLSRVEYFLAFESGI